MKSLETNHGTLKMPVFLPDATRGIVRSVDTLDVEEAKIEGLVVNTLHLSSKPGMTSFTSQHSIHNFMNWDKPIISDSGGFQVFSMIYESKMGSINAKGFVYQLAKGQKKKNLTPEKCIQLQFQIGADAIYCLDYCTHPDMDLSVQKTSVEYTIQWAKKCKKEYDRLLKEKKKDFKRPLLFAVVQGGNSQELRKQCAEELLNIGFDGFGFGGWPITDTGQLVDMVSYVSELIGPDYPKHALGIGKPENLLSAFRAGYNIFDCVIPTRDARHKRMYVYNNDYNHQQELKGAEFYDYLYMQDEKHMRDQRPIDEYCDCHTCRRYSRSYVHHLFNINDHLAYRLATIHNLRFYSKMLEILRNGQ